MSMPDVVVVGAGAAGCALATRLAEHGRSVLLLEAGPVPVVRDGFPAELLDAASVRGADPAHPDNWASPASLLPGRPYAIARGRILGGSSTINGAYAERARPADFARWADAGGGARWSYEAMLPLLRRLERDLDYGPSALHGDAGPVPVSRPAPTDPATAAFLAAAAELGHPFEADKNAGAAAGAGPVPTNAVDGLRVNAGLAYVLPELGRAGTTLEVRGGTRVRRVAVEGGRAVGVEVQDAHGVRVIRAGEVVLSGGAAGSAQLLLASGIGPGDDLARTGIDLVRNAPGVGAGFSDHPQVVVDWAPRAPLPAPAGRWMGGGLNTEDAAVGGTAEAVEVLQSLRPMVELTSGVAPAPGSATLPMLVSVLAPVRRGRIRLGTADPLAPPEVAYGYLATASDRARMRGAVRLTADLVRAEAFGVVAHGLAGDLPRVLGDDDALDTWIRSRIGTSLHTCGTAPFGADGDPFAVVDPVGRVLGVPRLRVADVSILPDAPTRGPQLTAVLIGEATADAMRDGD